LTDSCLANTMVLGLTMKSIWGQAQRHLKWAAGWKGQLLLTLLVILLSTLLLITPAEAAPAIFPSVLPPGQVGVSYSTTLVAAPITPPANWVVTGGTLPPGLTLDPPTGTISGTPTTAGTYAFFVTVTDATGPEVMDAPKTVTVTWNPDYTMPVILISLLALFLIGGTFGLYRLLNPPPPKPVAPVPAPAPPTIVLIEGGQKTGLESSREQLVEQFRHLLQKYEEEVKSTTKGEGLPEAKLVPEAQRLAAPKEEATCGYTSKNFSVQ